MPRPVITSPQRNSFTLRDGAFSTTAPRMGSLRRVVGSRTWPSPITGMGIGAVSKAATECPRKRRRFMRHARTFLHAVKPSVHGFAGRRTLLCVKTVSNVPGQALCNTPKAVAPATSRA
jgi:hypothetical protein